MYIKQIDLIKNKILQLIVIQATASAAAAVHSIYAIV